MGTLLKEHDWPMRLQLEQVFTLPSSAVALHRIWGGENCVRKPVRTKATDLLATFLRRHSSQARETFDRLRRVLSVAPWSGVFSAPLCCAGGPTCAAWVGVCGGGAMPGAP